MTPEIDKFANKYQQPKSKMAETKNGQGAAFNQKELNDELIDRTRGLKLEVVSITLARDKFRFLKLHKKNEIRKLRNKY